ncbi:mitochondrial carrier homolog 2 [Drosophila subobscura]|uniref:mitochondrial carrier homolog 2 n=1 Tax=Drosophila subobscura TaxID=7241 RepID=UPI00155A1914|nr:mitochondrial carrier homolog 2 [Drosophila subobscura]
MSDNRPEMNANETAEEHEEIAEDVMPLRNIGAGDGNYLGEDLYLGEPQLRRNRLVGGRVVFYQNRDAEEDHLQKIQTIYVHVACICAGVAWTTLMHPLQHAGVLMQLGFEPFPGEIVQMGLLGPRNLLPGAQHLIEYIHQSDGFFALYRGLTANIAINVTSYVMDTTMSMLGLETHNFGPTTGTSVQDMSRYMLVRGCRLTLKLMLTQPLTVVFTRQIAQFIGCESVYQTLGQTIIKIFKEEGIAAFYAGFVPRLLGKMGIMAITTVASTLFYHYCPNYYPIQALHELVVSISSSYVLHPLSVVGTCMDVQGSPLAAAMPSQMAHYEHWTKCFADIYANGGFYHRGGILFWRTMPVKKLDASMVCQN